SMMTAQWWPWVEFRLHERVPRRAFRPMPSVDGGLLSMTRRGDPLVANRDRKQYRSFVHAVFTGRGWNLTDIVARAAGTRNRREVRAWIGRSDVDPKALPKDLDAQQWSTLFAHVRNNAKRRTS